MPVFRKDFGHLFILALAPFGLGTNSYGNQLWDAPGVLDRFDSVFGGESPHDQGELPVGRGLDGCQINPLHV
jgi:hypothetical protein